MKSFLPSEEVADRKWSVELYQPFGVFMPINVDAWTVGRRQSCRKNANCLESGFATISHLEYVTP